MPSSVEADGFRAYSPVPQYPIVSIDHALKIILMLGERSDIRLDEVGDRLGVAPSTARRLLATLQYRGFAQPNPGHTTYGPGETWTSLVSSVLRRFDIRMTLRPFIEKLNAELRETVHVGVRDGAVIRFVDALESRRAVRVTSRLGRIVPAHCTSTGKAILAQLDPTDLRRLYPDEGLPGLTARSIRRRSELEAELAAVRRQGFAISREESEEGV